MRVAVTGANGFVGRHVVARLLLGGHDVRPLISERPGAEKELPDSGGRTLEVRRADVRKPESLRGAFDGIDAVVHTVAVPTERKQRFAEVNVAGVAHVVAEARRAGKRRPILHVPVPLMKPPAVVMGLVMADPPVTVAQLDLLAVDNTPHQNALEPVFGVRPRPFRGALDYLRRGRGT